MALFKCQACGAPLEVRDGTEVAFCPYCGMKQTLPKDPVQVMSDGTSVDSLLKRAFMFLEDGEFEKANEYAENVKGRYFMKESILYIGSENSFLQDADVPVKFFSPETQRPSIDELLTLCSQKGITAVLAPSKYIDIASPLLWHSDTVSKYILLDTEDFRLNESFNSRISSRLWDALAMQAPHGDLLRRSRKVRGSCFYSHGCRSPSSSRILLLKAIY